MVFWQHRDNGGGRKRTNAIAKDRQNAGKPVFLDDRTAHFLDMGKELGLEEIRDRWKTHLILGKIREER